MSASRGFWAAIERGLERVFEGKPEEDDGTYEVYFEVRELTPREERMIELNKARMRLIEQGIIDPTIREIWEEAGYS